MLMRTFLLITAILNQTIVISLSSPSLDRVKTGGCVHRSSHKLIHCAATPEDCAHYEDSTIIFLPADRMVDDECSTDNLPIGTCKGKECAITKDSCEDPKDYEPPQVYGQCNVEGKFVDNTFISTKYGGCMDKETGEVTCVLSSTDCFITEVWIPTLDKCRCHDVKIGACQSAGNRPSSCAISSADCDYSTFSPARSGVDCRLCPNADVTVFGNVRDGVSMDESVEMNKSWEMTEKEKASFDAGEIVGAVLGGLMTILFVVVGLFVVYSHNSVDEYLHVDPYAKEGDIGKKEAPDIPIGIV